jgi:hypothetical protein
MPKDDYNFKDIEYLDFDPKQLLGTKSPAPVEPEPD